MATFSRKNTAYLLMSEDQKESQRFADKIEKPFEAEKTKDDSSDVKKDLNLYFKIPDHLDLCSHSEANKSFSDYMAKNESPHDQMVLAAHSIANANAYLSSKLFKDQLFNKDIFKHTVRSIQKGFNALQAVGEQHNHGYIGDMLDCCKEKYHDCLQQKQPEVFLKEPMEMTDFKSADKNNLQSTEAGKETVTEAIASQFFNKKLGHYVARRPRRKSTKSAVIAHVHKAPFKK